MFQQQSEKFGTLESEKAVGKVRFVNMSVDRPRPHTRQGNEKKQLSIPIFNLTNVSTLTASHFQNSARLSARDLKRSILEPKPAVDSSHRIMKVQ